MSSFQGVGVSRGVAIGPAYVVKPVDISIADETTSNRPVNEELQRFSDAVEAVVTGLEELAESLRNRGAEEEAGIFDAHALMAEDPSLTGRVEGLLREGMASEAAVAIATDEFAAQLSSAESELMRERAGDVKDVGAQIQLVLAGATGGLEVPTGAVLLADDLAPSETARLGTDRVVGIVLERGGPTGHVAILARSLGIPAVVGTGGGLTKVEDGVTVALDGLLGTVITDPDESDIALVEKKALEEDKRKERLHDLVELPAQTRDGMTIAIAANVLRPEDAKKALEVKAEGCGLVRTELLYDDESEPDEEEQARFLAEIAAQLAPHRVVVRTFDIGADKPVRYLEQEDEANPFLGQRGIRLALAYKDAFRRQLRAVLRASSSGRVAVMYPFVSVAEEVREANAELKKAISELQNEGLDVSGIECGVMVEIPSLALSLDAVLDEVDFVSIGTNDLVQYLFAADRTNHATADIGDAAHPAALRVISQIVDQAHGHERWVGVCGEAASDPVMAVLFLGLGVDELSVGCHSVLPVKEAIRSVNGADAKRVARWAITSARSTAEVRERTAALIG